MVRKAANVVFGLALIMALGFALAHAPAPKASGPIGLSTPCEPASPAFKAADGSNAVSTLDSIFAAENAEALSGVVRTSRVDMVARASPLPAPRVFPPLLHRPPPANS